MVSLKKTEKMKKIVFSTFVLTALIGSVSLNSCKNSSKSTKDTPKGEVEITMHCSGPEFYSDSKTFRANAVGESMDQATSQKKAWSNVTTELAKAVNTTIKGVIDNYVNSTEVNNVERLEERYEGLTREVIDQELSGVVKICEKQTMTPNNNYKTYMAVELASDKLLKSLNERLSADETLKVDYDYEKFKKTFDEEMKKMESNR